MTHYRDNLGVFKIPNHLLEKVMNYVPSEERKSSPFDSVDQSDTWQLVKTIKSTTSMSTHRIERRGNELRCTCQGFKIGKKGYCKHTQQVAKELGI